MSIIVTGGAGFIGSNFVLDWIELTNEKIINVDKLTYAGNLLNLSKIKDNTNHIFVNCDISNEKALEDIFSKFKPRALINFAAESHVDRSIHGPIDFIETNILGTFKLLEVTRKYFNELDDESKSNFRFLHVSTDEVFGSLKNSDKPFTEENNYRPNSPYSASKAASDHIVRAWFKTYKLPVLTTNCSNNYGPFQFPEKLIPLTINNALSQKCIPIYGSGEQIRDWLYVKDHTDAIREVLKNGEVGQIYNIGGWNEKTNIEIVNEICKILDQLKPLEKISYSSLIKFVEDRPGHDQRYAIDATKIHENLNWKPRETFNSGIKKTVKWYLDNTEWMEMVISGSYKEWIDLNYKALD